MIAPLEFLCVLCRDFRLSVHICKFSFGEIKFMCIFWRFNLVFSIDKFQMYVYNQKYTHLYAPK